MKILNPLQMNDWDIHKFLSTIFFIQFIMWGLIGLNTFGLGISIVRQVFSFIYLLFIPGILILRIFRIHKLGNIKALSFSIGLSLAFLMFLGVLLNTICPIIGICKPFILNTLIIALSIVVFILCAMCFILDKGNSSPCYLNIDCSHSKKIGYISLVPLISIFGTYAMNNYHINKGSIFLIFIIVLITLIIGFNSYFNSELYPLIIFVISISLLYSTSLISNYLWGWDIHQEFYLANIVIKNSIWDPSLTYNTNAMLSIVVLAPIFSIVSGLNLIWVFKLIYPLIYSIVPLILYKVYREQFNDSIALFGVIYFMFSFSFYTEMIALSRQQIAELFLALILLTIFDKKISHLNKSILLIIFTASLAVSHYGLSYIYMFAISLTYIITSLLIRFNKTDLMKYVGLNHLTEINRSFNYNYILFLIAFTLAWYMTISSSSPFDTFVRINSQILKSLFSDTLSPETSQGLGILVNNAFLPMHQVTKILHTVTQIFISFGIVYIVFSKSNLKLSKEFVILSYIFFLIDILSLVVPFFAAQLQASRFYHISLILLAPICIIGYRYAFYAIIKKFKKNSHDFYLESLSIFFSVFLLFNSGLIYAFSGEITPSATMISLNDSFDYARFNEEEMCGANWVINNNMDKHIYSDAYRWLIIGGLNWSLSRIIPDDLKYIEKGSYIYMGTINILKNILVMESFKSESSKMSNMNFSNEINEYAKIYSNSGSAIYL